MKTQKPVASAKPGQLHRNAQEHVCYSIKSFTPEVKPRRAYVSDYITNGKYDANKSEARKKQVARKMENKQLLEHLIPVFMDQYNEQTK